MPEIKFRAAKDRNSFILSNPTDESSPSGSFHSGNLTRWKIIPHFTGLAGSCVKNEEVSAEIFRPILLDFMRKYSKIFKFDSLTDLIDETSVFLIESSYPFQCL